MHTDLRGFLPQCEEVATRRTGGAQGATDEAMWQKDRKAVCVFNTTTNTNFLIYAFYEKNKRLNYDANDNAQS